MIRTLALLFCLIASPVASTAWAVNDDAIMAENAPKLLSAYGFFTNGVGQAPAAGVTPYDLATPLFTDYADKRRFVYVPQGKAAPYNAEDVFAFPVGSVLIKSFGYPNADGSGFNPIETRLLLHKQSGWVALPYVWNADGTDATLKVAGKRLPVTFKDPAGTEQTIRYIVPNKNQCKSCHNRHNEMTPIGPKALHLNKNYPYADGPQNQLEHWAKQGVLTGLPANRPVSINAFDPQSAPLEIRARTYLDVNCGHCHRPGGGGDTSGLYLNFSENTPARYGVKKHPVAAGRGSGGFIYDIAPGKPDQSIILFRMESNDPGIAMPELGRSIPHAEGVALVREWIENLK